MVGSLGADAAAADVDIAVKLDPLGTLGIFTVLCVVAAGHGDIHRPALEIRRTVSADALSALAGVGDGKGAVVHYEVLVGLDPG